MDDEGKYEKPIKVTLGIIALIVLLLGMVYVASVPAEVQSRKIDSNCCCCCQDK